MLAAKGNSELMLAVGDVVNVEVTSVQVYGIFCRHQQDEMLVAFGAVLTPDMPAKTGSVVSPDPLYAFYSTLPNGENNNVGSTTSPDSDSEPADAERPANVETIPDPTPDSK